jgi:hemerythrin-like domain-containing protein
MKATEVLEREHRVIERVAETCGTCAEALRKGMKVPSSVLASIVAFLRVYGNEYHEQEEERLFSMLREKGVPAGSCPIASLEHEQQKMSVLIDQLAAAVAVYGESGGRVSGTLVDTLQAIAQSFPDHIWKENYLLLPMVDKLFSDEDQRVLAQALQTIDASNGEDARRTVDEFNAAIRQCSESAAMWERASVA